MKQNFFFLSFILLFYLIHNITNISTTANDIIFPQNIDYNEYKSICRESIKYNHNECYTLSQEYVKIISPQLLKLNFTEINETNKEKISFIFYNLGNINYHGYLAKEPNLEKGLTFFIISSYFGGPHSKYKLSIILSNGIFEQVYMGKNFQKILKNYGILKKIAKTEYFLKNFENFMQMNNNEYINGENKKEVFRTNLVISFLYSAALQNYPPAKKILAYKLNKGYDVSYSCTSAIKYYLDLAKDTMKEMSEINTKFYYNYEKLEKFEYIESKYDEDNLQDEKQVIELYWSQISEKKDEENLKIIKELAKMYYYGTTGAEQNFNISFSLFSKAIELNDTESLFFIGEHYLNGWGTVQNYTKAYEYFKKSTSINSTDNTKSWNSLGYLYYYGLGVEKDIKKAFDYFTLGVSHKDNSAIYDLAYLYLEQQKNNTDSKEKDFSKAYKHASSLASQDFSFGTYLYAMMNQYSLGSSIKSCDVNIKFFISICEKNFYIKYLYDLAYSYYRDKMYRKAFLIYLELAEGGSEQAQINTALLLNNYNIFIDKNFQKFLTYKYYYLSHLTGNSLASIKLGDFYAKGFGEITPDRDTAMKFYKDSKLAELVTNSFKLSHSEFNLGMMHLFNENSINRTDDIYQADVHFNSSRIFESSTYYPIKIAKLYYKYFYSNEFSKIKLVKKIFFDFTIGWIFNKDIYFTWQFGGIVATCILYGLFVFSLIKQKE